MTPDHVAEALALLALNAPQYQEAHDYYVGEVSEVFASRRFEQLFGNTGRRYRVNYARTPVDVLLERTQINGITVSDPATDLLLTQVWEANELGLEAKDLHRRVYEYGDAYLLAWPSDELPGGVEAYCHGPRSVRVFYDPARPRRKSHAVHTWLERGAPDNGLSEGLYQRVNLYYPDSVEQWVTRDRVDPSGVRRSLVNSIATTTITVDPGRPRDFVPYAVPGGEDGIVPNPTPGVIPVFHFRNARPYGRPEHADAYGPQNMVNKLNITMMASVDYAGFPQRYVTADSSLDPVPEQDAFSAPYDGSFTPDAPPGLSDDSTFEAGPGTTWLLSGSRVGVGQFAVADTSNFLNAIHSLIKQMATVTDVPGYYFDRGGQMPSGESFRMSENPLNKKLSDRLALLGVTWHEFFEYVLLANGQSRDTDAQAAWAPPQVFTDRDSWETAKLQNELGIPLDQIYKERGYSPDLAEQWAADAGDVTAAERV